MTFQREERYIVVKIKTLTACQEAALRGHLARMGINTIKGVVVEHDWPEHEATWAAIEQRCTAGQGEPI